MTESKGGWSAFTKVASAITLLGILLVGGHFVVELVDDPNRNLFSFGLAAMIAGAVLLAVAGLGRRIFGSPDPYEKVDH